MTRTEMIENVRLENEETMNYSYLGVRFELKARAVGEELENSKGNPERTDLREFPEYNSEEYANLPELDGTSAYDIDEYAKHIDVEEDDEYRIYVIGSDDYYEGEDEDEFVMENAEVVAVIK